MRQPSPRFCKHKCVCIRHPSKWDEVPPRHEHYWCGWPWATIKVYKFRYNRSNASRRFMVWNDQEKRYADMNSFEFSKFFKKVNSDR